MKRYLRNNSGSTLILLVIMIAITTVLGMSLLIVTIANYKLKKDNSAIKQAEYLSEAGLNDSYVQAYYLVGYSIANSLEKVQNYLEIHGSNEQEAEELFYNSYKLNIIGDIDSILSNTNPIVKIVAPIKLSFIGGSMRFTLQSKYANYDVVQITYVDMIIEVPNYSEILLNNTNISELITFENWGFSGE